MLNNIKQLHITRQKKFMNNMTKTDYFKLTKILTVIIKKIRTSKSF